MEAIRLPSALFGTVTIPIVYFQVRELFGRRAATIAALLLAISTVHIHFSRLAINVIEVPLFASLSLWMLARGIGRRDDRWYVLAGMAGGFGFYFHFGARLIAPILVLVLLGQFLFVSSEWRQWFRGTVLTGIGSLLALSPMITHEIGNPEEFFGHMSERGIWQHWDDLAKLFHTVPSDKVGILWGQTQRTFEAFYSRPDPPYGAFFYTFMNAPLLGDILSLCALAGVVGFMLRPRDMRARLILIWFIIPIIFASILTDTAGQAHRLIHPLVPAIIAASVAIDLVSQFVWRRLPMKLAPWVALPIMAVLTFSPVYRRPCATSIRALLRDSTRISPLRPGAWRACRRGRLRWWWENPTSIPISDASRFLAPMSIGLISGINKTICRCRPIIMGLSSWFMNGTLTCCR